MLSDPVQAALIRLQSLDCCTEMLISMLDFAKCTDACRDATIQFRQNNLKGQIDGIQSLERFLPAFPRASGAQHLQNGQIKVIP